jgi:hypothetical protein
VQSTQLEVIFAMPTAGASANGVAPAAAPASVWSALLHSSRSNRGRPQLPTSTLIVLGDKRCGKSSLLAKFTDRTSVDSTGVSAAGEYTVDYSYAGVKNAFAAAQAEREEPQSRMHVWSLDEPSHASLLPCFLQSTQPSSTISSLPSPPAQATVDYQALDRTAVVVAVDMSEPWRAVESLKTWLEALEKVFSGLLSTLPADQSKSLRGKISKHVQAYHTQENEAAQQRSPSPSHSTSGATSPSSSSNPSSNSTTNPSSSSSAAPIDANIPLKNLGVPLIFVGCKTDAFARHLGSGRSGMDEKFEFLTRTLRRLSLEYGAALIYTSAAGHAAVASRKAAAQSGGQGVNVDTLQQYIVHRLYRFPLVAPPSEDVPQPAAGGASKSSPAQPQPAQPKVLGLAEDDFGVYIPAGYDSNDLLETTSKTAVAAAYGDEARTEDVFKKEIQARQPAAATANAGGKKSKFDTLLAEDNTIFFKQLKHQLESGGGASALQVAAGLQSLTNPGVGAAGTQARTQPSQPQASHTRTATNSSAAAAPQPLASPSSKAAAAAQASAGGAPTPSSAEPAATGAGAAAASAGASGAAAPKGQIAVKQFFKSLLNNTAKPTDGNAKAAAAQKTVRANAEKELQRMTDGQKE